MLLGVRGGVRLWGVGFRVWGLGCCWGGGGVGYKASQGFCGIRDL